MLEFENVTFKYSTDDFLMLENLSFKALKGEFISIIGASGCGKSTILRLINGLEKLEGGRILANGKAVDTIKNYCSYMPQKDLLFPWRTIEKNIAIPLEIKKLPKAEIKQKCNEVLKEVGLLEYASKYPRDLSGGMKQRIAFGRTIVAGGEILLLDEPFSALDSLTRMDMQEWLLEQWSHFNKTILFVTHDVEEAIFLSKKIFVVKGKPVTKIEEIEIPYTYPRKRAILSDEKMIKLKENLIKNLRGRKEI